MTVHTLSMHHQPLRKQIILARWIMKVKIRTILELLWKTWNDSLADFQAGLTFDPAGVLLYEWGYNWNALMEVSGKDFITRWSSLSKRMLEAKTEVQLEGAHTELSAMKTLSLLKKLKRVCFKHLTHFIFIARKTNFGSDISWLSFYKTLDCLC